MESSIAVKSCRLLAQAGLLLVLPVAQAVQTNYYHVAPVNENALAPYDSWASAATNIQAAVDQAMAAYAAGDTECVVLVSNGVYTVASQIAVTNAITVRGASGNPAEVSIRGGYPASSNRCLYLAGGAGAEGLTLTNGSPNTAQPYGNHGGGAYLSSGSLKNCLVTGNRLLGASGRGAGVLVEGASSVVSNCVLVSNRGVTSAYGGGAYLTGGLMTDCAILNNDGTDNSPSVGGVYGAYCRIQRCFISGNSGRLGGANIDSGAILSDSVISNNVSSLGTYAGVMMDSTGLATNCLIVAHRGSKYGTALAFNSGGYAHSCIIRGNSAQYGVVHMNNGTLQNCLVTGNSVTTNGAVNMIDNGTIENCTIVRNQSETTVGGLYSTVPGLTVRNTIIYDNEAPAGDWFIAGMVGSTLEGNCAEPLMGGVSNMAANPLFSNIGTGFGTNAAGGDFRLTPASPCVDAGRNTSWMGRGLDLDGNPRIRPYAGGRVDIGCYEALPLSLPLAAYVSANPLNPLATTPVVLTPIADGSTNGLGCQWVFDGAVAYDWGEPVKVTHVFTGGYHTIALNVTNAAGESASRTYTNYIKSSPAVLYVATNGLNQSPYDTWETAASGLQAAVDLAGPRMSVVRIGNGTYVAGRDIVISNAVEIRGDSGNPADVILMGGYPATTNRVLSITGAGALVDGVTLEGGYTTAAGADGAGALITAAATLQNAIVRANMNVGSTYGGGVCMAGAGTIRRCLIVGNTNWSSSASTQSGGGVYLTAGLLENCTIVSNVARYDGGGVSLKLTGAMRGCLVAANKARYGGGVYMVSNTGHKQKIDSCTITGNSAVNGGGISSSATAASATNSIIMFNQATAGVNDINGNSNNFTYCCSSSLAPGVDNNISDDPRFARPGSDYGLSHTMGDYRLKTVSPCVDTGFLLPWMTSSEVDLAGELRVQGARPNRGAFEGTIPVQGTLFLIR
jgi:hypothetical protein